MHFINKIKSFIKKYKILIGIIVVVLIIILLASGNKKPTQTATVVTGNVTETALLSGKAQTAFRADLGFGTSGRVQNVYVKNNQHVTKGQLLARLEIGDLLAQRAEAEGKSGSAIANENTKVINAYRTMLSEDLIPTAEDGDYTVATPTISGIYTGEKGIYKIIIDKDSVNDVHPSMRTFDLEKTTNSELNNTTSTALGTHGLFISFPDDVDMYENTIWYLEIPNTKGSSYATNYNAWQAALSAKDRTLADTSNTSLQKIDADIRKNSIYAPFTGTVTNIEKQIGESVSASQSMISMLGDGNLEIVLQVPELDVSKIIPGDKIKVTFDAIAGAVFDGTISTINSRDTEINGVPVYEAFVDVIADARIKSGMTAYGEVTVAHKEGVLSIPLYMLSKGSDGSYTAQVITDKNKTETRKVTVGIIGSDSTVEVLNGLAVGDTLASFTAK